MGDIKLKAREAAKQTLSLSTKQEHKIVLSLPKAFVLDVEDGHFNFDRSVLLPDLNESNGSQPVLDARRVTGLGVVFAALVHAKKNAAQGLFVTGHTDPAGSASYNQTLSEQRAQNVSLLLRGKRDDWRKLSAKDDAIDDVQAALTWQHQRAGWDCDPGPVNNKASKKTTAAIRGFQAAYNAEVDKAKTAGADSPFKDKIGVDGVAGPVTWGAIYDTYMVELMDLLELETYADLQQMQAKLKAAPGMPDFVGCGEHIPFNAARRNPFEKGTDEHLEGPQKNPADRRVEILFFDPGEEVDLVCHPKPGQCTPAACPVYIKVPHKQVPIGIPPGLGIAEVNLRLTFVDPEGKVRPFPAGLPVQAKFGEPVAAEPPPAAAAPANGAPIIDDDAGDAGAEKNDTKPGAENGAAAGPDADVDADSLVVDQEPTATVGDNGVLQFTIPRRASTLHLLLSAGGDKCAISSDLKNLDDQTLLTLDEAHDGVAKGRGYFSLPPAINTREAYFELQGSAPGATFKDGVFVNVDNKKTPLGSREAPLELRLAIKWQHFKLTYFDRFTSSVASVPQAQLDEATKDGASKKAPLPLVLEGGSKLVDADGLMPDDACSSAWSLPSGKDTVHCLAWLGREILKDKDPRPLPDEQCTVRFLAPDLYVRTDGDGAAADAPRRFVSLKAADKDVTTPGVERLRLYDLPLEWRSRFYPALVAGETPDKLRPFEKVVTTPSTLDKPYVASLDVLVLEPQPGDTVTWDDSKVANRFTIFDNKLQVHKADPPTGEPYFTKLASLNPKPDGQVLSDLPPFTRLVARGPILYDVFDHRSAATVAFKGMPVGARLGLGMRQNVKLPMTMNAIPFITARPDSTHGASSAIGDAPLLLLRSSGRENDVELFHVFQYASVTFNFAFQLTPAILAQNPLLKTATALLAPPADADQQARDCLLQIADRWNGKDATNRKPATFEIDDTSKAKGTYRAFLSRGSLPATGLLKAGEVRINVFKDGRSFMNGGQPEGFWSLKDMTIDTRTGWFTPAHETGHIFGQPDEYLNSDFLPSYGRPNIGEENRSSGTPYGLDARGMMSVNMEVRGRYFWDAFLAAREQKHFAAATKIAIKRGALTFTTDFTTAATNQVRFPVAQKVQAVIPPLGLCDLFAYVTGQDEFTAGLRGASPATPYDGFIMVRVKMDWSVTTTQNYDDINKLLERAESTISDRFNRSNGLAVRGTFKGRPVRLRVLFAPRFICSTFPSDAAAAKYLASLSLPTPPTQASYQALAQSAVASSGVHVAIRVASGTPGIASPASTPRRGLVRQDGSFLVLFTSSHFDDDVANLFAQMVGAAGARTGTVADYTSLVAAMPAELGVVTPEAVA